MSIPEKKTEIVQPAIAPQGQPESAGMQSVDPSALLTSPPSSRRHSGLFVALTVVIVVCGLAIVLTFAAVPKYVDRNAAKKATVSTPLALTTYQDSVVGFSYPASFVRGEGSPMALEDFLFSPIDQKNPSYEGLTIFDLSDLPGATKTLPTVVDKEGLKTLSNNTEVYDTRLDHITFAGAPGVKISGRYKDTADQGGEEVYFVTAQSYPGTKSVDLTLKAKSDDQAFIGQFSTIISSVQVY